MRLIKSRQLLNTKRIEIDKIIENEIQQYYDAKSNTKTEKFESKFGAYSDYSAILEKNRRIAEEYDTNVFDEEEFNRFLLFKLIKRQEILNFNLNNAKTKLLVFIIVMLASIIFNIYLLCIY